ncbi:MAG TPA: VWA domain-containing protein [Gemmatimonadaceae bacterium]
MITFDYWWLLPLAAVLPALVVWLVVRGDRDRRDRMTRLGDESVVQRLLPPTMPASARSRAWRLALAGGLAGIGLAGPRWGTEQTIVRSSGLDMVLALDASLSMMANDDKPTRMERMKQEVRRLRAMSGGDRVGMIAFAGRSYVLSPLTVDAGALDLFLDNLDPSVVGQAGSSLARAIRQGTDLLSLTKGGADKALIIMSDGEAFEPIEDVTAEARRAGLQGISLVTVGFGTQPGSRIPLLPPGCTDARRACGAGAPFKKDQDGQVVITSYHPEYLRAAAEAANGTFIDAQHSDKATLVRAALASLRRQQRLSSAGETRTPRFQWFLLPALLLLAFDTIRNERVRRRASIAAEPTPYASAMPPKPRAGSREPLAATAVALALLLGACAAQNRIDSAQRAFHGGQPAKAAQLFRGAIDAGDKSVYTLYNYGTSLLAADSLRLAAEVLERATESQVEEVRYRALFNLGLARLKEGLALPQQQAAEPLDAALATYKKVLLLRSGDQDAKWNYELALRKKQQGGGGGGGGSGNNNPSPSPEDQSDKPSGGLGQKQAEQLLGSAAREERDVQQKRQQKSKVEPPPGGKDW